MKLACNIFVLVARYNNELNSIGDYYFTSAEEALLAAERIQSEVRREAKRFGNSKYVVTVKTLRPGVLKETA
jgi:hypothetical protein